MVSRLCGTGSDVTGGTTDPVKGTMVLQVLDLVSTTSEPFYGDCPAQTYTDLDINASGHTTCTVVPQGKPLEPFFATVLILLIDAQ